MKAIYTRQSETGWVVLTTLLLLIPMTLASLSLSRSVDTGSVIAGNLGFRHTASHAGEIGIEAAIHLLQQFLMDRIDLTRDYSGYHHCVGTGCGPDVDQLSGSKTGDGLGGYSVCVQGPSGCATQSDTEVRYVIQRLCNSVGECALPPYIRGTMTGTPGLVSTGQYYFRITCRVKGPGNSMAFVQSIALI